MMLRKIVKPYLFLKREAIQNQCIAYSGKETKYNMICNTACTLELSDFGTINGFEHVNLLIFFLISMPFAASPISQTCWHACSYCANNVAETSLSISQCMPVYVIMCI